MAEDIIESGVRFIADNAFYIEKSELYKNIRKGIRSVEFIRSRNGDLMFVEAKSSFPNQSNLESIEQFYNQINDVCDKFIHSLNLFASIKVGATEDDVLNRLIYSNRIAVMFVLVIKHHEQIWCDGVEKAIKQTLPLYLMKIWRPKVLVTNHANAIKEGIARLI
jgi:hypothetical protein